MKTKLELRMIKGKQTWYINAEMLESKALGFAQEIADANEVDD